MGKYLPYSGEHSIQEAVIATHFLRAFDPQTVARAQDSVQADLKGVFPLSNQIHQAPEIRINRDLLTQELETTARLAGFEFSKVKADAKPARALRLLGEVLTVNFPEYNGWKTTLEESLKYIRVVLSALTLAENPIIAFSLKYMDRYTFDGPIDAPRADMLFRKGNSYLTPYCFQTGPLWHCHSGWFEIHGDNRILNQFNVESTVVDQIPMVSIDHSAVYQLAAPRQTAETLFQPPSDADAGIENALEHMHGQNGSILRDVLISEMLERIGMKVLE